MGFTNQIDQSNITATTRILEENAANRRQTQQLNAQASENQKTREFTSQQYEKQVFNKFVEENRVNPLTIEQLEVFGSEAIAIREESIQKNLDATKKGQSGNVADRMDAQEDLTSANNALKKLAFDYAVITDDTQSALQQEDVLGDSNYDLVSTVSEGFLNKKIRVVLGKEAGQKGMGRYIEYKDKTDALKYISIEEYKNTLNNLTKKVDTEAWVKTVSANLETTEDKKSTGTSTNQLLNPEARGSAIDELLNDPKKLKALKIQFKENDPVKIAAILDARLLASKKKTTDDEATYRTPASDSGSTKRNARQVVLEQRRYEVEAIANGDEKALQSFFVGKASRALDGTATKPRTVKSASFINNEIVFSYDDGNETRVINNTGNINDLLDEYTYNKGEEKITEAEIGNVNAVNHAGNLKSTPTKPSSDPTLSGVTKALALVTKPDGTLNASLLVNEIKKQYKDILTDDILGKTGMWDLLVKGDNVKFFDVSYNVSEKDGKEAFIKAVSAKLNIYRNKKSTGVKPQFN